MTTEHITTALEEIEGLLRGGNDFVQCETKARDLLEQVEMFKAECTDFDDVEVQRLQFRALLALCYCLLQRGILKEALVVAEQALAHAIATGDKKLHTRAYINMGNALWRVSDHNRALQNYYKALELAEEIGDNDSVASATSNIGNVCMEINDFSAAHENYTKAIAAYQDQGNIRGVAHVFGNVGTLHVRLSEFPQALECYRKALDRYEELGNKSAMAHLLGNIANVYADLSDYSTALEYYARTLALYEELEIPFGIADATGNMGTVYLALSQPMSALECFNKSAALHQELGSHGDAVLVKTHIGHVYSDLADYSKALEYYLEALQSYKDLGSKRGVATVTGNIGGVYLNLGEYERALEYLYEALALDVELGDKSSELSVASTIGSLFAKKQFDGYNLQKAEEFQLRALATSESIGTLEYQYRCHEALAHIYEEQGRWREFAIHYKQFHELEQRVKSDEAKKKATLIDQHRLAIEHEKLLAVERERALATTTILYQVLPQSVADRLIKGEKIADYFSQLSILFADIVGFTPIAARMPAKAVLAFLNYVFAEFDKIMEKHGCQKIKTIGDGYMAVCGAPIPCDDHAERLARAALELMNDMELPETLRQTLPKGSVFHLRIGLHTGSAFAGIVGEKGFVYDVYSDAVNLASRMESSGEAGKIHCSADFAHHLQNRDESFVFEERDEIEVKGKGMMRTYFLEQR